MSRECRVNGMSVTAARTLALPASFDEQHRSLMLTEVANRAGLSVSTAHRLIGELVQWGALTRAPSGPYHIGRRI